MPDKNETRSPADVIRAMIVPWLVKGIIPAAVVNDVLAELHDAGYVIVKANRIGHMLEIADGK